MKGPLLILWACLSIFVFIALWVGGLPIPAMAVLVLNAVIGSVAASSSPPLPPKRTEEQEDNSPDGMKNVTSAPKVGTQNNNHGTLTISHLGIGESEDKMALLLYIDGEAKGEISEKSANVFINIGRHSIYVQALFRPPKLMPNGKAWAWFMNSTLKIKSPTAEINVISGVRTEVICKSERNGMGSSKLILYIKEQAAEETKPPEKPKGPRSKLCPGCSGEVKSSAQSCKFCGHAFEGVPA